MINLYDIAYAAGGIAAAPVWLLSKKARQKVGRALARVPERQGDGPAVLIHAVSMGEINAARALVTQLLAALPDLHVILTTTTKTGSDRARQLYGGNARVILVPYPLDFSPLVARTLDRLRPDVVVLMELEVWPNFTLQCRKRDIPVLVINGRLTPRSAKRYALLSPVTKRMFSRLAAVAAQEQSYADAFIFLGTPRERVTVTGTMKFDTADLADTVPGAADLAREMHLSADEPLWTCGSTGPGEEQLILTTYKDLLKDFPTLRLAIIPRHPERFDEVATLIRQSGFPLLRRSAPHFPTSPFPSSPPPVLLGDTMGELRKFYALATVVLVGRTLLDLGPRQRGSDMIEPAALAKPTIVGPWTQNFAEVMNAFRAGQSLYEISTPADLTSTLRRILTDLPAARETTLRARTVIQQNQGATARHVDLILARLPRTR